MQNYLCLDDSELEDVERLGPDAAFAYVSFARLVWRRGPQPDSLETILPYMRHQESFQRGWALIRPILTAKDGKLTILQVQISRDLLEAKSKGGKYGADRRKTASEWRTPSRTPSRTPDRSLDHRTGPDQPDQEERARAERPKLMELLRDELAARKAPQPPGSAQAL